MSTPVEFLPWASIPASHKRGEGAEREVLGTTFLGEPAWLPYMGEPVPGPARGVCAWCGEVDHLDRELQGCCSAECLRHHNGDH